MKPLQLEMQAFGPFPNKEVVDFTDLSKNGLFLICGETGSGKTTILDAITFALYGKGTNDLRSKVEDMRCNNAVWGTDTIIRYDMECKGNIYRFEIILECGRTKLNKKLQVYRKKDGVFEPQIENCKDKDIYGNSKEIGYTENLIGLTYEQFKQIVILPQGQFEKFLVSKSDDKEKILSEIFNVNKWSEISNIMYEKAKAKNDDLLEMKRDIDSKLSVEKVMDLDSLLLNIQNDMKDLSALEEEYKAKNVELIKSNIENEKSNLKLFNDYDILLSNKKKLQAKKDISEQIENKVQIAIKANLYKKDLDNLDRLSKDLNNRKVLLEKADKNFSFAKSAYFKTLDKFNNLKDKENIYKEKENLVVEYNSKVSKYQSIDDAKNACKNAETNLNNKVIEQKNLTKKQELAKQKYESLVNSWKSLDQLHKAMFDAYNSGIYGEIASHLQDGVACPVCGSIHHPSLAEKVEGTPSKEEVDLKFKEVQKAYTKMTDFEKTIPDLTNINNEVAQAEANLKVAKEKYQNINNDLIEGIATLKDLNTTIQSLNEEINTYKNRFKKLENEVNIANTEKEKKRTACDTAKAEFEKINVEYNTLQASIQDKIKNSNDFASIDEVQKNMLTEDQLSDYNARLTKYNTLVEDNKQAIINKEKEIANQERIDKESIETKEKQLEEYKREYNSKSATYKTEISRKQKLYDSLKSTQSFIDTNGAQIESDFKLVKSIRGDSGIGLQRYVLGVMFNTVINAANQMLSKVHDGRYKLYRSDEKGSKGNKKGLELYVYDNFCMDEENKSRSVGYLSGGEKFLVSLALSIGLSSVAQNSGIKLEAMFIDEGFGTLSTNSIDDAMNILMDIKKSSSVVGIISHVQLLRDNIPTKLEIVKQKGESHIKKSIG